MSEKWVVVDNKDWEEWFDNHKTAAERAKEWDVTHPQDAPHRIARLVFEGEEQREPHPQIRGTRCPSCGGESLFVGAGGFLTCSRTDCKQPGYNDALKEFLASANAPEAQPAPADEVRAVAIAYGYNRVYVIGQDGCVHVEEWKEGKRIGWRPLSMKVVRP